MLRILATCFLGVAVMGGKPKARTTFVASTAWCKKCGVLEKGGIPTCCAGAWYGKCSGVFRGGEYTWHEGEEACKPGAQPPSSSKPAGSKPSVRRTFVASTAACKKCGVLDKGGIPTCCAGAWYGKCSGPLGGGEYTWHDGEEACKVFAPIKGKGKRRRVQ